MPSTPSFEPHNHRQCIDTALARARVLAGEQGFRLTRQREQVLQLIWANHQPVGAYQLMEQLSQHNGKAVAPPTVYRALDFLLEHRLIHRINSLNAFVGCDCPGVAHPGQFMICRACGNAHELSGDDLTRALNQLAGQQGFVIDQMALELTGLCAACQEHAA